MYNKVTAIAFTLYFTAGNTSIGYDFTKYYSLC